MPIKASFILNGILRLHLWGITFFFGNCRTLLFECNHNIYFTSVRSVASNSGYFNILQATVKPAITMATILMSLTRIFKLGPEVSLNGSPTVSPTTVAL
jgi:hypothetical protein